MDESLVREKFESISDGDRAAQRTNPFAMIDGHTEQIVTADEVSLLPQGAGGIAFVCPSCKGELRHCVNARGTPYFAHATARGMCTGYESPSHLCIKLGIVKSLGLDHEFQDESLNLRYDAFNPVSREAVEVVCSGIDRYMPKIAKAKSAGVTVNWVLDSAAAGMTTKDGDESVNLRHGTVTMQGFFKPVARKLLEAIEPDRLFMFYRGLAWMSVGVDVWQLLDESHWLSVACSSDGGIKHQMVMMHMSNAEIVSNDKRRGVSRKTFFDRKFRYRGRHQKPSSFTLHWGRDRAYIEEEVSQIIAHVSSKKPPRPTVTCSPASEPSEPRHASVEDILQKYRESDAIQVSQWKEIAAAATQAAIAEKSACVSFANSQRVAMKVSPAAFMASPSGPPQPHRGQLSLRDVNARLDIAAKQRVCECGCSTFTSTLIEGWYYDVCDRCRKQMGRLKASLRTFKSRCRTSPASFRGLF